MRKCCVSQFILVMLVFLVFLLISSSMNAAELPKGVTLKILAMTGPWVSGPPKVHGVEWGEKTGNTVEVIEVAYADLFPKMQQAAATRSKVFDILLAANTWMADLMGWGYVIPLDNYIKDPEVLYDTDVPEGIKRKNTFGGVTYGLI